MSGVGFTLLCVAVSLVFGGTWGVIVYWLHPVAGLSLGGTLALLCFMVLFNNGRQKSHEAPMHNRRFNDA